jgi:DNA-binding response OmpR family regulator
VTSRLLDVGARELVSGARREPLTRREFDTMHYLLQHTGEIVRRDDIIFNVWGEEADVASNVVDVVVRALRKKLDQRAALIETISGVGYRLRADDLD